MKKSIFLFFAAILCAIGMNATNLKGGEVVLLKPSSNWKQSNARFAVYFFNDTKGKNTWVSMTKASDETDIYYAVAPTGDWEKLIYVRMDPGKSTNDWGSKWNQSGNCTWTNASSLLTVGSSWDNFTGNWSAKKVTSKGKLVASSANVSENEAVTLTPSLTTNTAINTILSTEYTISPATGASVSDNTFTATAAGTYTVTATIKYRLNGYTSTSFESTVDAKTTITVASAAEPKHDVTVIWTDGTTELKPSQTLSVGESTEYPVEAPEFKDYTFSGWTLGTGVQSTNETANPINITTKASGEYTLVANYDYIEPVIKTIYCKMEHNWWAKDGAAISAYISGTYGESTGVGSLMTLAPLESNVWKIDIDVARYQKVKFIRVSPDGASNWGAHTGLVEIPTDDKNLYTITQTTDKWGSDCPGTWSVYEAPATAPKRYITGSKELVGGEGWKANEIEMTYDNSTSTYSHTFLASALTAGTEYKLKVTEGNWDGGKWGTINGTIPGVSNDGDGNVCFTLKTAGDVTITFDGSKITVSTTGEFKVPVVYPYYILGTMNSWSVKEEYGLADEDEDGVYTREITLAAGSHYFKINIGKWDSQWGWSNVTGKYAEATDAKDDNKIKITLASEKTFVVEFNKSNNQITFEGLTEAAPVVNTYTVVGSSAPLFGTAWAPELVANDLALVEGTKYQLVKSDVNLAVAEIKYKVAVNHAWEEAYPATDAVLNITEAGKYTITFTFDSNTKKVNATAELTEAAVVLPTVGVKGAWDGWAATTTLTGDNTTAAASVNIATAGVYEFGLDVDGNFLASGATIDKANNSTVVTTGAGNMKLTANVLGEYTFTWTYETNTLTVTYPAGEEVEIAKKYYIAGPENLTGFNWSANGLEMTKDDDVYKHTFSELAAGTYEFKITDGQWNTEEDKTHEYTTLGAAYEEVSYNEGNIKIVTEEAINLTVIFDGSEITFEGLTPYVAPLTYTVTVPAGTEKCYIAGNMNGWAFQEMEAVTGETNKFTITIVGAKETDEYKYACQADWVYAEVIDGGGNRTNWSELDEVTAWGKPVVVTYQLKGVGGWDQPGIELVQNPGNDKEYMLTCQAISATDAIKVVRLEDGVIKDYYGKGTVKDGVEVTVNYDGDGNITLTEGKYNFYFDTNEPDKKLWIAAATDCGTEPTPEVIRTGLTAGNYYTICMNKEMKEVKGATLWSFCGKDANFAYLVQADAPYTAGMAYIMYAEAETVSAILTGEPAADPVANGAIHGTFDPMDQAALDAAATAAGSDIYLVIGNELRLVNGQADNSLPANRAYVVVDEITGGAPAGIPANRVRSMPMQPQVATGMENVDASAQPVKTIINGQLFILRGEKMYDAQGKLVK